MVQAWNSCTMSSNILLKCLLLYSSIIIGRKSLTCFGLASLACTLSSTSCHQYLAGAPPPSASVDGLCLVV